MRLQQLVLPAMSIMLILLVVSVFFNFHLLQRATQFYMLLNKVRLDPLGLKQVKSESIPEETDHTRTKRVVFLGDSRAMAWPSPETSNHFRFINRGICSQTTEQVLRRYPIQIDPLRPDILVIQLGINDLKTIPLFPVQKKTIIENCCKNIAKLVMIANQSGAAVILTTNFPVGDVPIERKPFWSEDVPEAILEINNYMRSLAADNVIVLDAYSILIGQQNRIQPQFSKDLLHINTIGYAVLNDRLTSILNNHFLKETNS